MNKLLNGNFPVLIKIKDDSSGYNFVPILSLPSYSYRQIIFLQYLKNSILDDALYLFTLLNNLNNLVLMNYHCSAFPLNRYKQIVYSSQNLSRSFEKCSVSHVLALKEGWKLTYCSKHAIKIVFINLFVARNKKAKCFNRSSILF